VLSDSNKWATRIGASNEKSSEVVTMADSNITAMIDLVSQMLKDNQRHDEESVKREIEWRELLDE